jgi:branched-chain amino acid transport system substrate-binding protein
MARLKERIMAKKKWNPGIEVLIAVVGVIGLALLVSVQFDSLSGGGGPLYVAVVGPMSGKDQAKGAEMVRGVSLYIDQINAAGGINGRTVEMLPPFDDQNDPDLARQEAQKIAESQALVVFGHRSTGASIAGGAIYQEQGVPAISGSEAETVGNDWYFRTTSSNGDQAIFLANYVRRILGQDAVSIIYDQDAYGSSITENFENSFQGLGGQIKFKWSFDAKSGDLDAQIDEIVTALLKKRNDNPGMLFMATHGSEAVKIVTALRRKGLNYAVIGTDSLGTPAMGEKFATYPEEQSQPGYLSDGIYAVTDVLFDVGGEEAAQFKNNFIKNYGEDPGSRAATYYNAAVAAFHAMEKAEIQGDGINLAVDRLKIRNQLLALNNLNNIATGIGGPIYFDGNGDVVKAMAMGIFDHQKFISALTQLKPITDLNRIPDLEAELAAGSVHVVNGEYMLQTNVVYAGMDINEISNLDIKNSAYTVDFYLWFRYRGDFDPDNIEFINIKGKTDLGEPIIHDVIDGITHKLYRVKTEFIGDFSFYDYPFDQQDVEIKFRHVSMTRDQLLYVVDVVGIRQTTSQDILAKFDRAQVLDAIDTWEATTVKFFQDSLHNESTLGSPHFFDTVSDIEYSRFNANIGLKRDVISFTIKNLLPLFAIIILAYIAALLAPAQFAITNAILRGALLTVAFFHIKLSNDLPGIGYTVALDNIFYMMYVLIVLLLILTVLSHNDHQNNKLKRARMFNQIGRVLYPVVILGCGILFVIRFDLLTRFNISGRAGSDDTTVSASDEAAALTGSPDDGSADEAVVLTLGSWRVEDDEQMARILAIFNAEHPNITVKFTPGVEYQPTLTFQLENGIAPDMFYLSSYSFSQNLFRRGFLETINDVPGLTESFPAAAIAAWATDDGTAFGVPFLAVSHGVYYNQDIFNELGLEIPTTWAELLTVAQALKAAGYIPIANAAGQHGAFAEEVFMSLAPNFIGGQDGREEYLNGARCFNDPHTVAAYQAVLDLGPYLPENGTELSSHDSKLLFLDREAAMMMGGSWEISFFEGQEPDFEWSVFAIPAPEGQPEFVTFHPDAAIGLSIASPHKAEAKVFLEWLTTPAVAELLNNELPGFFSMQNYGPKMQNEHASTFLSLNQGRGTDVRWPYPVLRDSIPDGFALMKDGTAAVIRGEMTPQEAADTLQSGLAQWYKPAQVCGQNGP